MTLIELVPQLIGKLVSDWTRGQLLSRCFRDLLIRRSLALNDNSTVGCIWLARAGELSSRRVGPTKPLYNII